MTMDHGDKIGFWLVLAFVFVAEIPCILRTIAIQVRNESIWSVVLGTMAGNVLALVVGVILAKFLAGILTESQMHWIHNGSAIALIVLGAYMLFGGHAHSH